VLSEAVADRLRHEAESIAQKMKLVTVARHSWDIAIVDSANLPPTINKSTTRLSQTYNEHPFVQRDIILT
jgi:hypothetical protein